MKNTSIYIFDTAHYLEWCKKWELNKNNAEVLRLFKSRCDFEKAYKKAKRTKKGA